MTIWLLEILERCMGSLARSWFLVSKLNLAWVIVMLRHSFAQRFPPCFYFWLVIQPMMLTFDDSCFGFLAYSVHNLHIFLVQDV